MTEKYFLWPPYHVRKSDDPNTVYEVPVTLEVGEMIRLPDGRVLGVDSNNNGWFKLVDMKVSINCIPALHTVNATRVYGWHDEAPIFTGDPVEVEELRWKISAAVATNSLFVVRLTQIAHDLLNTSGGWLAFIEGLDEGVAYALNLVEKSSIDFDWDGSAIDIHRCGRCP